MKRVIVISSSDADFTLRNLGYRSASTSRMQNNEYCSCYLVPKEDITTLRELVDLVDVE